MELLLPHIKSLGGMVLAKWQGDVLTKAVDKVVRDVL